MKKMNYRTVFYWLIVTPFILLTISHYEVVFFKREVISTFSKIISWGIGISIDVGFMFFLWFYQKIKNKYKTIPLVVQLLFIYFFQYRYYSITEPLVFDRIVFSAFFPFMLGVFAFIGKNLENIKNQNQDKEEIDPDIQMLTDMGIDMSKPEIKSQPSVQPQPQPQPQTQPQSQPQPQYEDEIEVEQLVTDSHSRSVTFTRKSKPKKPKSKLIHNENGTVTCPFCGVTGNSVHQLNGAGHNTMACMEKEENRKNIEMGVKVIT